ncbi:hypothetical protein [Escherichia coli]
MSKDIQVDESVSLMIKLIETDEPAILDDIVRGYE